MANKLRAGIELSDGVSAKLDKIMSKVNKTGDSVKKANKKFSVFTIGAGVSLGTALNKLGGTLKDLGMSILDVTQDLEVMGLTLEVVTGSAESANALFGVMREWARTSPLETKDVVDSFVRLQAIGVNPTIEQMETLGNVALVFGRQMTDVLDGFVGLNKRTLRQLGIDIDRTGKKAIIISGDMRIETEKTSSAIRDGLVEMWEKRFPDALAKASGTTKAKFAIMRSEIFELKDAIGQKLNPLFKAFAEHTTTAANALRKVVDSDAMTRDELTKDYVESIKEIRKIQKEIADTNKASSREAISARGKWSKANAEESKGYNDRGKLTTLLTRERTLSKHILDLKNKIIKKSDEEIENAKILAELEAKKRKADAEAAAKRKAEQETEDFFMRMQKSIAAHEYRVQLQKDIVEGKRKESEIDAKIAEHQQKIKDIDFGDNADLEKRKQKMLELIDIASSIGREISTGITDGERGIKEQLQNILKIMVSFIEKQAIAATAIAQIDAAAKAGILGPAVLFEAAAKAALISGLAGAAKAGISSFADGTNGPLTQPTLAEVGERGREIVALPAGAQVINNQDSKNISAQSTFNVYINGSGGADQETIKRSTTVFVETIRELERQGKIEKGLLR